MGSRGDGGHGKQREIGEMGEMGKHKSKIQNPKSTPHPQPTTLSIDFWRVESFEILENRQYII